MATDSNNTPASKKAKTETDWSGKKIFTTGEAARVCKVSQQTIIRCFDSGRLQGFRVPGSKFRRIPREELIRFMKANQIPVEIVEGYRKRILVVDDDPQIIALFDDLFGADHKLKVKTAGTGYEAGLLTESFRPHLIVLDYMLPDINGNVVCERLRANEDLSDIRVVFVSGVVDQDEVQHLLDAGADAFIKKPFRVQELMDTVTRLLGTPARSAQTG